MAFLCVALLLSVADGQLHNPYSPLFENTLRQNQPGSSVKQASSPTLDVLFFMKSSADTTHSRPPSERRETRGEGAIAGSKSAELPPGLSKLFTSLVLPKPHSKRSPNVNTHSGTSPGYGENPLPNPDTTPTESSHTHSSDSTIAGNKVSLKLDSTTTGKSFRANHGSNHENYRKIRRNRDRNHHRKARQRHASLPQSKDKRMNSTNDTNIENTNTRVNKTGQSLQRDTIADQHYRFLLRNTVFTRDNVDNVPQGTEKGPTPFSGQIQKVIEVESYTPDTMTKDKKSKVRKSLRIRKKRGTALPGQFSPLTGYAMGRDTLPGDTFFYRRPEGHSGALGRSHDTNSRPHDTHSGSQPDPLVHSLEIENEEEDYQRPTPESPPIQASVELDDEEEEVQEKEADLGELQGEPEQDQAKTQEDVSDPMPSAAGENSTLNETLARQMFRSPMLVDYGSRVKPADVLQPTEADPEDPALGGGDEEGDPLWTEEKALEEDISLEAESPKEEDPPKVPVVEPETEEEPTQEEPESEAIELPVIPQEPLSDLTSGAASEEAPEPAAEAESEAEPEAEPEAEHPGFSEPEGETEPESSSEPEQEKPEGEPVDSHPYAEPQPEWEEAKKVWGPWWEIHIYGIGLAFAVLCVYSFVSVLRLWQKKNLLSQGYFIALNAIMFLMGAFRAVYFLVDGYNAQGSFHIAGNYFLYSIGFPCLTSAFSILLLALLQTLKMQILSPKIQRTRVVIGIIAAHFLLSIVTDIVVGYLYSAKIMLFVCQVATVFWGLVLFIGYIYVFRKLYKAAKWRQNEMMRLSLAKFKLDGISPITKAPRLTLNMAVKITLATSVFGLILAGLQTYGIVGVYSIFSTDVPNPWTWLVFNTGMRLTELAMCITMSYVATQPFRYNPNMKGGEHHSPSCFSNFIYMAPCRRIFECDSVSLHDDDLSWNDLPVHGDHGEMDNNGAHVISEEATPMTANGRAAHAAAAAAVANHNEREGSSSSKRSNKVAARPASLLVSDNGFIRFREDGEMGGSPVLLSTDDELENISGDNMIRNPFYRDLLRRQEKERAVGRATFVNSDGITLQDEFGLVESVHDPELVPPPRATYPVRGYGRGCSYPNTGTNTPGTPRSFCSTDLEYAASEISYRPPSSIHLRDSIENALNIPGFTLRTPDILDSPLNTAYLRTRRGSLMATRGARPMGTGSMSDLESLRHYGPGSRYGDSEDTMDTHNERAASPDSMYSYTLSNLTRAPLVRSYSDSIGKASQPEVSYPNSPERRYYKDRLRASMLRNHPENAHQFQNLLKNINDMCNVYNKLSPDDREGDE